MADEFVEIPLHPEDDPTPPDPNESITIDEEIIDDNEEDDLTAAGGALSEPTKGKTIDPYKTYNFPKAPLYDPDPTDPYDVYDQVSMATEKRAAPQSNASIPKPPAQPGPGGPGQPRLTGVASAYKNTHSRAGYPQARFASADEPQIVGYIFAVTGLISVFVPGLGAVLGYISYKRGRQWQNTLIAALGLASIILNSVATVLLLFLYIKLRLNR